MVWRLRQFQQTGWTQQKQINRVNEGKLPISLLAPEIPRETGRILLPEEERFECIAFNLEKVRYLCGPSGHLYYRVKWLSFMFCLYVSCQTRKTKGTRWQPGRVEVLRSADKNRKENKVGYEQSIGQEVSSHTHVQQEIWTKVQGASTGEGGRWGKHLPNGQVKFLVQKVNTVE